MSAIMELIKGLFCVSMAVSLSTSESKLLGQFRLPPRQLDAAHPTAALDCYCPTFNPHSMHISRFLSDTPADLERVVVYFYKNKETNKLVMHTPGKEKQKQIPETPYDAGDHLLTIGTETVVELYDNILRTMSQEHHNAEMPQFPNSHRLIDYAVNSENSVLNTVAAMDITDEQSLDTVPVAELDVDESQLGMHEIVIQNSNENLHHNLEKETVSPFGLIPSYLKISHIFETAKNNQKLKQPPYNFNRWFEEQLYMLPELTDPNNEFIDFHTLKTRIVRILREHDFNLVDGYLRDVLGNNIDMTNLQLLQITIHEKDTNIRGEWSPLYADGLMLVFLNPLHVLGVILLKKSHSEILFHTLTPGIPKKTSTMAEFVYRSEIPNEKNYLVGLSDKGKSLEPASSSVSEPLPTEDVLDDDMLHENSRRLTENATAQAHELVGDIIKTFGKYYNPDIISEVYKHLKNEPSNGTRDTVEPEFRIIGGHAALQSGTPLNYKARSAF